MFVRSLSIFAGAAVLLASNLVTQASTPRTHPPDLSRHIVWTALRAVEGDSVAAQTRVWNAEIKRHPKNLLPALGLATLSRLTYNYDLAEQRYRAIIAQAQTVGIEMKPNTATQPATRSASSLASTVVAHQDVVVYALLGLAWQADTRGQTAQADTMFYNARIAARSVRDSAAEAEAMLGWAFERGPIDGALVALAIIDSAASLIPDRVVSLQADYWTCRSILSAVLGRSSSTNESLRARQLARQAQEPRLEAKAIGALALDLKLRGHDDSATVLYDSVEALQRQAKDRSSLAETLLRHGDALRSRGDLGGFKQKVLLAASEAEHSHNDIASRSVLLQLGALALLVHDYSSADYYLEKAIARNTADNAIADLMLARAYRANLYLAIGDIAKARTETQAVADYHHSTGDGAYELAALRDLVYIELRAGRIADARRALMAAESLSQRRHEITWDRWLDDERGFIALARGDLAGAQRYFSKSLAESDSSQHMARHMLRVRLAEIHALRGNLGRAEQLLVSADTELDRWRATLADRELRTFVVQASSREQTHRDESMATTLAALARGGRATTAFMLAERRRARELTDRVVRAQALLDDANHTAKTASTSRTSDGTITKFSALQRALSEMDMLVAIPDQQTALIEYVAGTLGAPTTLFVVTRKVGGGINVNAYILPSADSLSPSIGRFVGLIEAGEDPVALARELGKTLLDSAVNKLTVQYGTTIKRLIVVPDGPLHMVPFDALRLADGSFVVERFAVSLAPSGNVIAALRKRGDSRAAAEASRTASSTGVPSMANTTQQAGHAVRLPRILVFGDPTFDTVVSGGLSRPGMLQQLPATEPLKLIDDSSAVSLPRLEGSSREARLVSRYSKSSEVRLRDEATSEYLRTAPLSDFQVIHFATHALVDERTAARTTLALAPTKGYSGFVSPGELAALHLEAGVVVLSACRTAAGVVVDGEGVQGLTSSFLEAGAQSVVASQWRIADQPTVQVVESFYNGLAQGLTVADALQYAKLAALKSGLPARDWAAFTVIGDPTVRIPLSMPANKRLSEKTALLVFAVILGVLGIVYGVRRKSRIDRIR